MSLTQRLCYLNSMTFWLFPLVRMVFLLAPLAYLFFGLQIFVATIQEVMVYMGAYMAVSFMVQSALYARVRWPLMSELYETAQAPYLSGVVIKTLLRPRGAKFNVTAKDEVLEEDYISPIFKPLLVLWVICALGVIAAGIRWILFPGDHTILSVVGGWALFNFIILSASLRAIAERQQRRGVPRVSMQVPAVAAIGREGQFSFTAATILDSSTSGARLQLVAGPDTDHAEIAGIAPGYVLYFTPEFPKSPHLENAIRVQVTHVERTNAGLALGVRYDPDQPLQTRETIAHLIFGDSAAWEKVRASKNRPMPMLKGMGYVVVLAVSSVYHTFHALIAEPARRRAAVERARLGQISASAPAHILAFGEAFDPQVNDPGFEMGSTKDGLKKLSDLLADAQNTVHPPRGLETKP